MTETGPDAARLIRDLISDITKLPMGDEHKLDLLQKRVKMVIRRSFGPSHEHLEDLRQISFPLAYLSGTDGFLDDWFSGESQMLNLLKVMLEEIEVYGVPQGTQVESVDAELRKGIFVAHGRDEGMKEATARTIEALGLEAVLLEERPKHGRTIAEQLEHCSDVSYAVILFSPDDMAYPANESPAQARPRARQNVIDELGYFRSKLGRKNIFILYRKATGFEAPSNIDGVLYVPYDESGNWKFRLVQELQNRSYDLRLDKLLPSDPKAFEFST